MAWKLSDIFDSNFLGGLLNNNLVIGGLFIKKTIQQRNTEIRLLDRQLDGANTTLCYVSAEGLIYELISNPSTESTDDSNWKALNFGVSEILEYQGTWDADNTNPVLADDPDALNNGNHFFTVTGAPSPVLVQHAGLFQGNQVEVKNGDWIISNGQFFFVNPSPVDWNSISNIPQVILDYVNGIVIAHNHEIAEVNGLVDALNLKFDASNVADKTTDFNQIPDEKLIDLGFLKLYYYRKTELYTKAEIDALFSLSTTVDFNWNRPATKTIQVGEIPGGTTIQSGLEEGFYGELESTVVLSAIDPIQIGELISPTVYGQVIKNDADFIVSITILDEGDNDVGSPVFTPTDTIIDIAFQVDTPITGIEAPFTQYKIQVVSDYAGEERTVTSELLLLTTVYPFLFGVAPTGLDATGKYNSLIPLIEIDGNKTIVVNSNDNKIWFCMPEEYPNRVQVIDNAGGEILGSLFPVAPTTEQVDSVGLAADWSHNYKVYESNYITDSNNVHLTFIIDRADALATGDNSLDDILEGNVNKHLTKPLKEKLVNFNGDDYLTKATYDSNGDGVVGYAAQFAFTGQNNTGQVIAANTAVNFQGGDLETSSLDLILADKDTGQDAAGVTLVAIPSGGGFGLVLRNGAIAPYDTTGHSFQTLIYLGSNGGILFAPPASGLIQPLGYVLVPESVNGALYIEPTPVSDLNSSIEDWVASTFYARHTLISVPTDTISGIPDGDIIQFRAVADYTSALTPQEDANAGDIEIVGGNMFVSAYDPNGVGKDVFDSDSMVDGLTEVDPAIRKVTITENQRIKLDGLQPSTFKGTFTDPDALRTAFPEASDGDSANVTSTGTVWQWDSGAPPNVGPPATVNGDWVDSLTSSGGDMLASVYDNGGKAANVYNTDNHDNGTTNKVYTATEQTKLANIEPNATADQSNAEIKVAYEANADTNAYTNAEQTKLANIEVEAKDDQLAAEVPYTPLAPLVATDVQAGLNEIKTDNESEKGLVMYKSVYDANDNAIVDRANQIIEVAENTEAGNMNAGDVVYIDSVDGVSEKALFASNNDTATVPITGIVLNQGATTVFAPGATIQVGINGVFQIPSFGGFSAGDSLYLATGGQMQNTLPTVNDATSLILVAYVSGIVGGDSYIEMLNLQAFRAAASSFDPSTSILTTTSVQAALAEAAARTVRVMGTLSFDDDTGTTETVGEIALPTTLSGYSPNTSSPQAGRLAVGIDSDVTVTISVAGAITNGEAQIELAVNGVLQGIRSVIGSGGNQETQAGMTITHTLQLSANDYVSVFLQDNSIDVFGVQITINGNQT